MGCLPWLLSSAIVFLSMVSAQTGGTRFISDSKPEKRHFDNHIADDLFQGLLTLPDLSRNPVTAVVPSRTLKPIPFDQ